MNNNSPVTEIFFKFLFSYTQTVPLDNPSLLQAASYDHKWKQPKNKGIKTVDG